jgi:hypothetical protein
MSVYCHVVDNPLAFISPQVNKALFAAYNFEAIFTLLTAQMVVSYIVCTASRDYFGNPFNVPHLSRSIIFQALPLGLVYVANISVGLMAMKLVNIPMFFGAIRMRRVLYIRVCRL